MRELDEFFGGCHGSAWGFGEHRLAEARWRYAVDGFENAGKMEGIREATGAGHLLDRRTPLQKERRRMLHPEPHKKLVRAFVMEARE